jgi:hypothetical protein
VIIFISIVFETIAMVLEYGIFAYFTFTGVTLVTNIIADVGVFMFLITPIVPLCWLMFVTYERNSVITKNLYFAKSAVLQSEQKKEEQTKEQASNTEQTKQ